ncbi:signal peptide peptidase SppA [Pseudohoeflea coraliihabitans]|uniref:Signal peptide peptidase SppA n=1 Tax=Pseudohoeflea coraliihabitans TaxID=2860393 RepID=A0ABS6WNQ3_9HYPH|nr:signal peptide peptidase SppA [Pseudohoeflea sp. DP4N28-3]MBW3097594.1 signal peptide peptidase SppA [Pseudohoeflea sp. DP4N28-3]
MDADSLIDRRRLRRKLGFWRAAAILVAVLAIGATLWWSLPGRSAGAHIARISISGVVTDDTKLLATIEKAAASDAVKAIVVSLSTPGGTTYGGERIYRAIEAARASKPVVADVRSLAASAGYMIAAAADHIVAGETSIVGSIGVLFQYPQVSELMDKIGVELKEIKSAPLKAEPSPFHPASPAAEAMIRAMVMDSYDWFVDLVAERRGMPRDEVLRLADGSIYTGRQSLENGLVDALGGEAAIRAYLTSREIDAELEFVDWKPRGERSFGVLPEILAGVQALVRRNAPIVSISDEIDRLGGGKLFLDGLVSNWQAGAPSP